MRVTRQPAATPASDGHESHPNPETPDRTHIHSAPSPQLPHLNPTNITGTMYITHSIRATSLLCINTKSKEASRLQCTPNPIYLTYGAGLKLADLAWPNNALGT